MKRLSTFANNTGAISQQNPQSISPDPKFITPVTVVKMLKECGLLLVCWAAVVSAGILQPLPSHAAMGDCRSNEDCGPDRCCLLGNRFFFKEK